MSYDDFRANKPKFPVGGESMQASWDLWKTFLSKEKNKHFKTFMAEEAGMRDLLTLSGNNPETAKAIINQSISKNWASLYALKGETEKSGDLPELSESQIKAMKRAGMIK